MDIENKQEATSAEPEVTGAEPEATSAEPEVTGAEPEATSADQEVTGAEPDEAEEAVPEEAQPEPEDSTGIGG